MGEVASGSQDGVSFWDAKTFDLKRRTEPFPDSHSVLSSLSWGANNQRLAIVPRDGNRIALGELQEQAPTWKYLLHKDGVGFRCGCFMGNSRYMVAGCTSPQVHLWDTQAQDIVKTYQGHTASISAVARSLKDNHIVSGADNGQILLHATTSTQLLANLTKDHRDKDSSSKQAVTQLAFSHHDRALIGSSAEDGSVCLWSTESQRLLTRFSQKHAGPAVDVCFSPYNKLLMVSTGTDAKITCYDIQQRRSVTQISTPVALSSVAVLRDGMTLVGGGTDGKLYVYELRNVKSPRQVLEAHQSAVTCISEQLPLKTTASKGAAKDSGAQMIPDVQKVEQETSELSSEGLVVHTPFIPTSYPNRKADLPADMPKLVLQTPAVRDAKMTASVTPAYNAGTPGIFSPLESDANKLQPNRATAAAMQPPLRSNESILMSNPGVSSIFSPLVTGSTDMLGGPTASVVPSTTVRQPLLPRITTVGASAVPLMPLASTARPLVSVPATTANQPLSAPLQDVSPVPDTPLSAPSVQSSITTAQTATCTSNVVLPSQQLDTLVEMKDELDSEQNIGNVETLPLSSSLTRSTFPSQHVGSPAIQVQYIESLIKDTAEELRYEMHRDVRALSLDIFRQFFIQQQQLAAAVTSLNEKLEKLSAENQKLQEQLQQYMPKH